MRWPVSLWSCLIRIYATVIANSAIGVDYTDDDSMEKSQNDVRVHKHKEQMVLHVASFKINKKPLQC